MACKGTRALTGQHLRLSARQNVTLGLAVILSRAYVWLIVGVLRRRLRHPPVHAHMVEFDAGHVKGGMHVQGDALGQRPLLAAGVPAFRALRFRLSPLTTPAAMSRGRSIQNDHPPGGDVADALLVNEEVEEVGGEGVEVRLLGELGQHVLLRLLVR